MVVFRMEGLNDPWNGRSVRCPSCTDKSGATLTDALAQAHPSYHRSSADKSPLDLDALEGWARAMQAWVEGGGRPLNGEEKRTLALGALALISEVRRLREALGRADQVCQQTVNWMIGTDCYKHVPRKPHPDVLGDLRGFLHSLRSLLSPKKETEPRG